MARAARCRMAAVSIAALAVIQTGCSSGSDSKKSQTTIPVTGRASSPQERAAIDHDVPPPAGAKLSTLWLAKESPNWAAGTWVDKKKMQFPVFFITVPGTKWTLVTAGNTQASACAKVPPDI